MRRVMTRVLPEPAPARTSKGPSRCITACRWGSFRSESKSCINASMRENFEKSSVRSLTIPRRAGARNPALPPRRPAHEKARPREIAGRAKWLSSDSLLVRHDEHVPPGAARVAHPQADAVGILADRLGELVRGDDLPVGHFGNDHAGLEALLLSLRAGLDGRDQHALYVRLVSSPLSQFVGQRGDAQAVVRRLGLLVLGL